MKIVAHVCRQAGRLAERPVLGEVRSLVAVAICVKQQQLQQHIEASSSSSSQLQSREPHTSHTSLTSLCRTCFPLVDGAKGTTRRPTRSLKRNHIGWTAAAGEQRPQCAGWCKRVGRCAQTFAYRTGSPQSSPRVACRAPRLCRCR